MKIKKLIISFLIPILLMPVTFAYSADEDMESLKQGLLATLNGSDLATCEDTLRQLYDVETLQFFQFLEATFQNKSSNSTLINIAIEEYRRYKKTIWSQALSLEAKASPTRTYSEEHLGYASCTKLADTYVRLAKEQMIQHIRNTNYQKKTTILTEKYNAINNQLRDLNFLISRLYGFFMTFKNKLPGFLQECITK